MKKIFAIANVKNESDIIESFCRYNLTYCDGIIIVDNGSLDNTKEIIHNLINEGLPIYLAGEDIEKCQNAPCKMLLAQKAMNQYNADLILPLDADEFLYHVDGKNPRETLEALDETIEYHAAWRTYIYAKEPDISRGFLPNNFTHYRNPKFERCDQHRFSQKVIASKFLIKDKRASFAPGSHYLTYPKQQKDSAEVLLHSNLVFAHFPIRGKVQVLRKTCVSWIYKWKKWIESGPLPRDVIDKLQLGVLFNHLRDNGGITADKMKELSLEYALLVGFNQENDKRFFTAAELKNLKADLGENILIEGSMDTSFCSDKLGLRYTDYNDDSSTFLHMILSEIDSTITFLADAHGQQAKKISDLSQHNDALTEQITAITQHANALTEHISGMYNSRTWKVGWKINRAYRFFFPYKKQQNETEVE